MNTYKFKILVPLDFSETGPNALLSARYLAGLFEGTITPMHVMLTIPKAKGYALPLKPGCEINYMKLGKQLKFKLDHLAQTYVEKKFLNPGIVEKGSPSELINQISKDYDLIVMSSHGYSGYKRYVMGSITEEVIRFSRIPVLIVKERLIRLEKIMICTDFSDNSQAAFPWALELAKKTRISCELVYVASFEFREELGLRDQERDRDKEYEDELVCNSEIRIKRLAGNHFVDLESINTRVIPSRLSVYETLTDYIASENFNLVIMSTLGHSDFEYQLMGSTTANIIRFTKIPVLVVRSKNNDNFSMSMASMN